MRTSIFITCVLVGAALSATYDYADQSNWSGSCTSGTKQSPINVLTNTTTTKEHTGSVVDIGTNASAVGLENGDNTNTLHFDLTTDITFKGVPGLDKDIEATAAQIHIHWGKDSKGSEHLLQDTQHALEMHLVNTYTSSGSTMYTVYARFFKEGSENAYLKKMITAQEATGASRDLTSFDLLALYPKSIETVYTYEGSLTTPGCDEKVHWVVIPDILEVSTAQLTTLRAMKLGSGSSTAKTYNWREEQDLNSRTITKYTSDGARVVFAPLLLVLATFARMLL